MSLYVDSSALLTRYIDEPDSDEAEALLQSDPTLLTARHAIVEVAAASPAFAESVTPAEVANVVLFLASDLASVVHGVAIPVDGGWTASAW